MYPYPPFNATQTTSAAWGRNNDILHNKVRQLADHKLVDYYQLTDRSVLMMEDSIDDLSAQEMNILSSLRTQRHLFYSEIWRRKRQRHTL